jgi:hypothetical protein
VSHGSLLSFSRYLVLALALALLAPYAGCHLLTSAPDPVVRGDMADSTIRAAKEREPSSDYAAQQDREAPSPGEAPGSRDPAEPRFSEIENLLREP